MSARAVRGVLYAALAILYLLHNDLWLWYDGRLRLGLPAGLSYHLAYCLACAVLMALLVRRAWPAELTASAGEPSAGEPSAGEPSAGEPSAGEPSAGEPSEA